MFGIRRLKPNVFFPFVRHRIIRGVHHLQSLGMTCLLVRFTFVVMSIESSGDSKYGQEMCSFAACIYIDPPNQQQTKKSRKQRTGCRRGFLSNSRSKL